MKCFYDYIYRIAFPRFSLYFANGGTIPSSERHKIKSLYAEDYIYIVYKYVQDTAIEGSTMHMLRVFAHSKFRGVAQDFYMSTVPVKEPVNLANFYFDYAAKIDNILLEARSW